MMSRKMIAAALAAAMLFASAGHAQDKGAADKAAAPAMTPEQQKMMEAFARMGEIKAEQKQLAYFAGNWTSTAKMWMDPKGKPEESSGKSTVKALWDGRYYEMTHSGDMMGQPFSGTGLLGYDNLKGKFFSTWIDTMSTGIWVSYGTYDAAKKTYTYHGDMDDPMAPGTVVKVRQVITIIDDTHYTFDWYELREGKEVRTMQMTYTKV